MVPVSNSPIYFSSLRSSVVECPTSSTLLCTTQTNINVHRQKAEAFLAALDSMGAEAALRYLEKIGSQFAKDTRVRLRELEVSASTATSLELALQQAQKQRRTTEGHRTFQTILTAAAFGEADDDGDSSTSGRRRAAALGVNEKAFNFAAARAKKLMADLSPAEAIKNGVYWFWPRAKRSDAASDELVLLMRQYWHSDEVSRATGNSADRDMWKASKSPTAERHPRRQLTEPGGGDAVYAKFLKWAEYRSFKARQGDDFTDPGRSLFLSTRCKCLILPAMEQCACKIHSQQVLYIEALANVDMTSHGECRCRWCCVEGGSKWRETWKHLGTFSDAIACPKVDLRAADPKGDEWMGRRPECNAFDCEKCGFSSKEVDK